MEARARLPSSSALGEAGRWSRTEISDEGQIWACKIHKLRGRRKLWRGEPWLPGWHKLFYHILLDRMLEKQGAKITERDRPTILEICRGENHGGFSTQTSETIPQSLILPIEAHKSRLSTSNSREPAHP